MTARIRFTALPTETARALRAGAPDANGQPAERAVATAGCPCRHCLDYIPEGSEMLILALRPFPGLQPYAELGPVFLCAGDCPRWEGEGLPPVLRNKPQILVKGYTDGDRIAYGTGQIVSSEALAATAAALFDDPRVAYGHARSATNNCYTCRIDLA